MAKRLLLAAIDFRNVAKDDFYDGSDTEHLLEREQVMCQTSWPSRRKAKES